MVAEDVVNKVFEYLKKHGQTNTFRLATELGIDRHELLNIVKRLREKQAIEIRSGIARFLKFPRKEKKVVKKRLVKVKKARIKLLAMAINWAINIIFFLLYLSAMTPANGETNIRGMNLANPIMARE